MRRLIKFALEKALDTRKVGVALDCLEAMDGIIERGEHRHG